METNYNELLENLANKLGTTTEYLWNVLLHQAYIDATTTLFQIISVIVACFIFLRTHKKFMVNDEHGYNKYDEHDAYGFIMIIIGVFLSFFVIMCFCAIGDVVNGFFNPEYWALNKILKSID